MTRKARKRKAKPLSPKQRRFVDEYLVDGNATQAAIRAGYSRRTAAAQAHDLLKKPEISRLVAERAGKAAQKADITIERVLEELALLGFSDIGEVLDFSGDQPRLKPANLISPRARRLISSIKVKRYVERRGRGDDPDDVVEITEFKLWSKDSALEKLGKYLKMFVERHEHTGKDGAPLMGVDALRALLQRAEGAS